MNGKLFITFLLFFCIVCFTGCEQIEQQSQWTTDQDGNRVVLSQNGNTIFCDSLPVNIAYNTNTVTIKDAKLYQDYGSDYSYTLYLVIAVDVSSLSEAELHWLRESDIDVRCYLTSPKNGYDFNKMTMLGNLLITDENTVYYVLTSSFFKENRYSFSGAEVTLSVDVTQEETYEYENDSGEIIDLKKRENLHYSFSAGDNLPSAESIQRPLYDYICQWLQNYASFFE